MTFRDNRREVKREMDARFRKFNAAAALTLQNNIRQSIRDEGLIDTGRYVNGVTSDSDESGAVAGTNVSREGFSYPTALEFGTRYMQAYAPMRKGAMRSIPDLKRIYADGKTDG